MSSATRKASGQFLVLGIFFGIIGIAAGTWWWLRGSEQAAADQFTVLMNSGKTFALNGDPLRATSVFNQALGLNPQNPDVHLNLANVLLLADRPAEAAPYAAEAVHLEGGNPAGHFLLGCALLRQSQYSNAVQSLQIAKDLDRSINPVSYQLGRAYAGLGQFEDAAAQFTEVTQFETNHPSAFYQLSQALLRLNRRDEALVALSAHQAIHAGQTQAADNPGLYEKCAYTEFRAPLVLEQPDPAGVAVRFVDDTAARLGDGAAQFHGPLGVFDFTHTANYGLLALRGDAGPQVLAPQDGRWVAQGEPLAGGAGRTFTTVFVGDLNNDRADDAVFSGPAGTLVIRCATNGLMTDVSRLSSSAGQNFTSLALADLEFTGKLGVLGAVAGDGAPRFLRGSGNFLLRETNQSFYAGIHGVRQVVVDDVNNDDLPDVLVARMGEPPLFLANVRGGKLAAPVTPPGWPVSTAVAVGDFNNDFRADVALLTDKTVDVHFGGLKEPRRLPQMNNRLQFLRGLDYDNDGWVDLIAWGADGIRVWRNRGRLGFHETTGSLGLKDLRDVRYLVAADFDRDGDTDFIVDVAGSLRWLRNDGGNANAQLKLALFGNRSNKSGLGVKVEAAAGGWRILRSVPQLPVEIGLGRHTKLDALNLRWFDTLLPGTDVTVDSREPVPAVEIFVNNTGSCPYLYAWDGANYRFVTDLLGGAPLGLPVVAGRHIEADPEELVWVGDDRTIGRRGGRVSLQITEELREILYLDQAQLVVVDRLADLEVHSTSQLRARGPFPKPELISVGNVRAPVRATRLTGEDVTSELAAVDGRRVSPAAETLRGPQFRGLAEPHGLVLDFGPAALTARRPLVLVLNGWLRFGGGMANIAAAQRDDFPFPFPVLEGERADGTWVPLDVPPAAPAGKTKTILLDLTDRLPEGLRRLRLTQAFEIHWDRIALGERFAPPTTITLKPDVADLHYRGYSPFEEQPLSVPQTPVYQQLLTRPNWTRTPSGWATRYGNVLDLIDREDQGLCLVAGGDELTLEFAVDKIPAAPPGHRREYYLRSVGWDKDGDYHVTAGTTIEPLPWRGQDDQSYGLPSGPSRPAFASDGLHARYNTRWVGPAALARRPGPPGAPAPPR